MLQIRYGTNLAPEIKENKIDIIKNEPFTTWDAGIINIQKQKYYLLVEKDTSFPILLTKLDAKLFNDVFANAIKSYDFILFKQQQKLVSAVKSKQMSFYDTKSQANLMLEKIRKLIEDNQNEYLNLIDVVKDEKNMVDKLTVMSAAIFALDSQIGQNFISKMIDEVSTYFPIKPQKPNRRYKYVDLVPKFEDFSNFEKYENKPVKGNEKIVAKIKENINHYEIEDKDNFLQNKCMYDSVEMTESRKHVLNEMNNLDYDKLRKKYFPEPKKLKIFRINISLLLKKIKNRK